MSETNRLSLPLVQPAQAQKHVTVNEALVRLDGLVNLVLNSVTTTSPPAAVVEGVAYGVPAGAVNAWSGREGQVAIGSNGGWVFATPQAGWRAFVLDRGLDAIHTDSGWIVGALSRSAHGAGLKVGIYEADHVIGAGNLSVTTAVIPGSVMVIGVTARVLESIGGTLAGWSLGHAGAEDRFGSGMGLAVGSWGRGLLSQPMTYWAPEALQLRAEGGDFASGRVRLAIHYLELMLPSV